MAELYQNNTSLGSNEEKVKKTYFNEAVKRFMKNKLGVIGLVGVLFLIIIAGLAPLIADKPSGYGDVLNLLKAPNSNYWFGTDALGLSIFDQVVWGTRVSLFVGLTAGGIALAMGVPIGLLSGYYGGRLSNFLMSVTDIFLTLPVLPLMIIMAAVIGTGVNNVAVIIGLFSWPQVARITRAETMAVTQQQFIEAAQSLGSNSLKIIFQHILINVIPSILVNLTLLIGGAVLSEAGLSFLGLGDPESWSWGTILQNAHATGAIINAWWHSLFPSIGIIIMVLSFNFLGMGINDALNPKLKGR